jgi:putative membrane protein
VVDFTGGFTGMWVMALISGLMGLVITVGLIALIVLGIRWFLRQERASQGGSGGAPRADDSLEVLRRRYAAGEIDEEEYERRRRTLAG